MEDNFGLRTGVECKFVRTEPEVIETIATKRGIPLEKVKVLLRYNVFTVNQFSVLSGLAVPTILNKTRPTQIGGKLDTELDFCFPFQDDKEKGPKFILRNEKSEKYLKG